MLKKLKNIIKTIAYKLYTYLDWFYDRIFRLEERAKRGEMEFEGLHPEFVKLSFMRNGFLIFVVIFGGYLMNFFVVGEFKALNTFIILRGFLSEWIWYFNLPDGMGYFEGICVRMQYILKSRMYIEPALVALPCMMFVGEMEIYLERRWNTEYVVWHAIKLGFYNFGRILNKRKIFYRYIFPFIRKIRRFLDQKVFKSKYYKLFDDGLYYIWMAFERLLGKFFSSIWWYITRNWKKNEKKEK